MESRVDLQSTTKPQNISDLNPNARYVMKAFLPNFEVSWPMWSEAEQSGYSGIMEAPGELVHGALYEMTEQELIAMDNLEDCYKGTYKRETFLVLGEDGNQSIQIGSDTCNKSMNCPLIKNALGISRIQAVSQHCG